jgi:hypothetical protein
MNVNIASVYWERRYLKVVPIVEFVKELSYLIWQSFQYRVFSKLASIAMRNCVVSHCMVTQVVTPTTRQRVDQQSTYLCAVPNVNANPGKVPA